MPRSHGSPNRSSSTAASNAAGTCDADLLVSTGRADLAIDAYRTAHECDPSSFRPLLAIVTLELQLDVDLGDPDEAVVEASRIAIGQVTADPQLDFLIAVSQSRELDDRVARERFRRSLDAEPDRPERLLAYARFEAERGRWDEAADAYRRAIATTDTGDSRSEVSVAHLADQLGLDEPAIRNDDWGALASVARIMVDDDPAGCEGHRMLGLALCELEQWTDALAPMQEAVNCRPTDLHVLEKLAHSASQAGRHDIAVDARQRSLTVDPTARRFHALAVDLQVAGREEEAARAFEHSVRLGLPSSTWFERFGAAQRRTSAWSGAAVLYRWALERHPDGAHLWYLLGFSLEHAGEPVEAEHAYRRAIDLQPDNANWWFRLGYLLERFGPPRTVVQPRTGLEQSSAGDYSQAADCYRRAIELDGTRVAFLRRLAGVEELLGDLDSAQATLERAIELDADDATTWHLLGRTIATRANRRGMYHTEEHDQLERIWGKAIELQPYRSGPRDQLTPCQHQSGTVEAGQRGRLVPGAVLGARRVSEYCADTWMTTAFRSRNSHRSSLDRATNCCGCRRSGGSRCTGSCSPRTISRSCTGRRS